MCVWGEPRAPRQVWPGPGSRTGRHGRAGPACVPTGVCWRQRGRLTRQATSSGWARTAGAPRARPCCTWRRWQRALSPSFPRGCLCEVGPAACLPPLSGSSPAVPSSRPPTPFLAHYSSSRILPFLFLGPHLLCADVLGLSSHTQPSRIQIQIQDLFSPFSFLGMGGMGDVRRIQEAYLSRTFLHPQILPSLLSSGREGQEPHPAWAKSSVRKGGELPAGDKKVLCQGHGILPAGLPASAKLWVVLGVGWSCPTSLPLGAEPIVTLGRNRLPWPQPC